MASETVDIIDWLFPAPLHEEGEEGKKVPPEHIFALISRHLISKSKNKRAADATTQSMIHIIIS